MRILGVVALGVALAGCAIQSALAQLDITPPGQKGRSEKKNIGNEMGALSKRLKGLP